MNDNFETESKTPFESATSATATTATTTTSAASTAQVSNPIQPTATATKAAPKRSSPIKKILVTGLCGLLFGATAASAFIGINSVYDNNFASSHKIKVESKATDDEASGNSKTTKKNSKDSVEIAPVLYEANSSDTNNLSVTDIAQGAMPSMVAITNTSVQEVQQYFGFFGTGNKYLQESQSSGSGIIISEGDDELLIVTNYHVVADASTLTVAFSDESVCEATVKGTDPDNDLAIISVKLTDIDKDTRSNIRIAPIGNSDDLVVGEQVVAIGNALGYGQSVTTGIVSALNRQVESSDATMIQTDAAINPGNSGGALLNMRGEVIGINSLKCSSTDVEGMGYAISISSVKPIIENIITRPTRDLVSEDDEAYLGVYLENISDSMSKLYGIPRGIYVTQVVDDGPADDAGLKEKSIITHFDGVRILSTDELSELMKHYAGGETVEITYEILDGDEYVSRTTEVTLGFAKDY